VVDGADLRFDRPRIPSPAGSSKTGHTDKQIGPTFIDADFRSVGTSLPRRQRYLLPFFTSGPRGISHPGFTLSHTRNDAPAIVERRRRPFPAVETTVKKAARRPSRRL